MPKPAHDYVIFSSAGNDSIALVQWLSEAGHTAYVVYSNTGWAQPGWDARVARMFDWAKRLGHTPIELSSEGMVSLVARKKAWPRNQIQFCTTALKIDPAKAWLAEVDPDCELECCIGIRRCESKRRSTWPEHTPDSDKHGGRDLWAPLVRHTDDDRAALLKRAGWEELPHRSMECYPCINANRGDFKLLTEERIAYIEQLETEMGVSPSTGKPKTMFRPYRHLEAIGIREVVRWANSGRGKFVPKFYADVHAGVRDALQRRDTPALIDIVGGASPRLRKYLTALFAGEDLAALKAAFASCVIKLATEDVTDGPGPECDAGMCGM